MRRRVERHATAVKSERYAEPAHLDAHEHLDRILMRRSPETVRRAANAGRMKAALTPLLLLFAACLEVGGDAIVRVGLKHAGGLAQVGTIVLGGFVLLAYGLFVNIAPADFGRLLGVYVALFFVVAQVVNLLVFGIRPGVPILVGGAFILAGGIVITVWKT